MIVSVIVPIYNVERYLKQCVNSVISQSYENLEIILVDDGSTDGSPQICDDYERQDTRIKVVHKLNGGLSDARNSGLDRATGDVVMFLDSDDWWDDMDAVSKVVRQLEESGADICIFGMKKYYQNNGVYEDVRRPVCDKTFALSQAHVIDKYIRNNIFVACAWDKAVRRAFIESNKLRFVKGQLSEDIEWCCKILLKNPNFTTLDDTFYVYRQQVSTSISANVGFANISSILDVISRYAVVSAPEPLMHYLANQYVLLLTNFMRLDHNERILVKSDIKAYWWLLKFNWSPYVRMVTKVSFLGYEITTRLLRLYYLLKRI